MRWNKQINTQRHADMLTAKHTSRQTNKQRYIVGTVCLSRDSARPLTERFYPATDSLSAVKDVQKQNKDNIEFACFSFQRKLKLR